MFVLNQFFGWSTPHCLHIGGLTVRHGHTGEFVIDSETKLRLNSETKL